MANHALIIGNSKYDKLKNLPCCEADVAAIDHLVKSCQRYDNISRFVNLTSNKLKDAIRSAVSSVDETEELFIYFTGHGHSRPEDFYFCTTDFDTDRPNETGLSTSELHSYIRDVSPKTLVKIIDACGSGLQLIKSEEHIPVIEKGSITNIIQISSCHENQSSFTGEPLSVFTHAFCNAVVRKEDGRLFYSDLIGMLRDAFISDDGQTPHFVSQGAHREFLVDDAQKLDPFRAYLTQLYEDRQEDDSDGNSEVLVEPSQSLLELIEKNEESFGDEEQADVFINAFFNRIIEKITTEKFSQYFDLITDEHTDYYEESARGHIIRCLSRERRPDNFVEAYTTQKKKRRTVWETTLSAMMYEPEYEEHWTLNLNCTINRAQIKFTFKPKFKTLNQMALVVSLCPSLNQCYIFETLTNHLRTDWDAFESEGRSLEKHWYECKWDGDPSWIEAEIVSHLEKAIQSHLDRTAERLSE